MDSGALFHMASNQEVFSSYTVGDFGSVKVGDYGLCKVAGMGDVWLKTNVGCKLHLKKVRNAPNFCLSIISVKALNDDGHETRFGGGKWKITKGSLMVVKG